MKVSRSVVVKTLIVTLCCLAVTETKDVPKEKETSPEAVTEKPQANKGVKRSTPSHPGDHKRQARQYLDSSYNHSPVEPPEPIIEIIIKESNETGPHGYAPPPVAPPPKKKEEVQVFYVNYKKDKNNKLQLEPPVAALSPAAYKQSASDEPEVVYPQHPPPTPLVPLKTTTLRTIIHPDSEKYHSNSGIHVTFGSEHHQRNGYHLQEQNAESVIQSVVARPEHSGPTHHFTQRSPFENSLHNHAQNPISPTSYQTDTFHRPFYNQNQNYQFRGPTHPGQTQHVQPQLPSQPQLHPQPLPQPQYLQQKQSQIYQQQQFPNHNFHGPTFKQPPFKTQSVFQGQPERHTAPARPLGTQSSHANQPFSGPNFQFPGSSQKRVPQSHKPIPIPLQGAHPNKEPQYYTRQPPFESQNQQSYSFQSVPSVASHHQTSPTFNNTFNTFPSVGKQANRFNHQTQQQEEYYNFHSQIRPDLKIQSQHGNQQLHQNHQSHHPLPSFQGSEVLKSVPKFEQHITETVPINQRNQPITLFSIQNNTGLGFNYHSSQNSAIQNIPAPQLSTPAPSIQGPTIVYPQITSSTGQGSHQYNNGQSQQSTGQGSHQYNNDQSQQSTGQGSHQYHNVQRLQPTGQGSDQYNKVQSLQATGQGSHQYNNGQSQQATGQGSHQYNTVQSQQSFSYNHHGNQLNPSYNSNRNSNLPPPGHSVSTLHTDALRELEQRQKNYYSHSGNTVQFGDPSQAVHERSKTAETHVSSTTTAAPSTEETSTEKVNEQVVKQNVEKLPDEVPDDLRQQLLSSGILANADISILDYDKIGDVDLENLPPEHLANFYNNGGESQISASNKVLTYAKTNGEAVKLGNKLKPGDVLPKKQNIDLKVVQFSSNSQRDVSDKYIKNQSTVLPTVDINSKQYHNYLPFKIEGALFPIPEAEELKNIKISSVVVLAPIESLHGEHAQNRSDNHDSSKPRNIKFYAGDSLNELIRKPSKEKFKAWLDTESKHKLEAQSVVLLVTQNSDNDQDIYMYDITTKSVSKLSGNISMTFVKVAEANSQHQELRSESVPEIDEVYKSLNSSTQ